MQHLKKRKVVLLLCFLIKVVLLGCLESGTGSPTMPTLEATATSQATPVPHRLETLLAYVPQSWADVHVPVGFGPAINFLDVAQIRADLGIPAITGADSRQAKQDLIRGLNTQNLRFGPVGMDWSYSFDEWGWDIADVDRVLHLRDFDVSILVGNFGRPEIREHLSTKGYMPSKVGDFTVFTADEAALQFALKPDTLIIGSIEDEIDVLETLVRVRAARQPGLDEHPTVVAILDQLDGVWGAVLAPSPDIVTYAEQVVPNLRVPSEFEQFLKEKFLEAEIEAYGWDFMAITFQGLGEETTLHFLYHYPSEGEASKDIGLVRRTLTETPYLSRRGRIWSDFMDLESVEVRGTILVARARTRSKHLIGSALEGFDFWGFLPIRQK